MVSCQEILYLANILIIFPIIVYLCGIKHHQMALIAPVNSVNPSVRNSALNPTVAHSSDSLPHETLFKSSLIKAQAAACFPPIRCLQYNSSLWCVVHQRVDSEVNLLYEPFCGDVGEACILLQTACCHGNLLSTSGLLFSVNDEVCVWVSAVCRGWGRDDRVNGSSACLLTQCIYHSKGIFLMKHKHQ